MGSSKGKTRRADSLERLGGKHKLQNLFIAPVHFSKRADQRVPLEGNGK
jgi:hypothetical protein